MTHNKFFIAYSWLKIHKYIKIEKFLENFYASKYIGLNFRHTDKIVTLSDKRY